jgi:uncharacterized membrane protein SpoIIM required for sporulation/uncharacterized RDD family membrane protein YckC
VTAPYRAPTRQATLDATVDVETPEHVSFSYTLAGIGSRSLAAFLDHVIMFILFIGVIMLLSIVQDVSFARALMGSASGAWGLAILIIVWFVLQWGYFVICEWAYDGQTPAKRWLGLRVVQDGGYSVTFATSAVRNLARFIDLQPVYMYAVGIVSVVVTKSGKRIGDLLAGTIVVRERVVRTTRVEPARQAAPEKLALHTQLTDDEFAVLSRFMERRLSLKDAQRNQLTSQLAARFRGRVQDDGSTDAALLAGLHTRESAARARGVAARSDTGAAREQHALVAAGTERWASFSASLARVQRDGMASLPEQGVSEFVAQYREVATDLARLQTATRGREVNAVFYVSRLVAAAHNLIYRQRSLTVRSALNYLTIDVPREIRQSVRPILLAAVLFFAPMAIAWIGVVRHPDVAPEFLPGGMIERAELGVARAEKGEGYIEDPQIMRPVMASGIIANNIQVTIAVFVLGVTAGIGTLLLLVFNGISIGGVLGLYHSKGILELIVAFVAPHSVLELGAICIAGGAGLLVGAAILLPGNRTRREAFTINGRRAIRLLAATTIFLILAGTIEGFISPIPWWPLAWKATVTAVSAVFFFGFILLGRRATARIAP